jgi:hypothetical protein
MNTFSTPGPLVEAQQIDLLASLPKPGDVRVNRINPLWISGLINNLPADEGDVYGINRLAFLDEKDQPTELNTAIDPWLNMSQGDEWIIEATYSQGNPITLASDTVSATQVDNRLFPTIKQDQLPDGVCELLVGVRRISNAGGEYERSAPLTVLIKTTLPGGPDTDLTEPYHQGLQPIEVEQDVLDNGLTKDYLDDNGGLPVTIPAYENMRKNSTIYIVWGSRDTEFKLPLVTATQVGKPIKYTIPASALKNLPPINPLLLTYRLKDVVDNHSSADAPPVFFLFDPALVLLEPPIIDKADGEQQLDLDALLGEDVQTDIFSSKVSFVPGDVVALSWRGVSAGGRQVPVDMTWEPEASTRSHTFMIPYYPVHLIARGFVKVDYRLTQATTPASPRYSRTTYAKMIGMPLKLAAPEVREDAGGSIAVDTDPAHVIVKSQPGAIVLDDIIYVDWYVMIPDPDNPGQEIVGSYYPTSSPVSEEMVDRDVSFTIPKDHIQDWHGARVLVSYTVRRADTEDVNSEILVLQIGDILSELPPPVVHDAKDDVLIPEDVPQGAGVTIEPYPGMRALHIIRLYFIGANPQDSWSSVPIELTPEMVGVDLTRTVPFEKLVANRNNTVELVYSVTNPFTHTQQVSKRLLLNIGSPIPNPDITAVKDANGIDIARNSETFATRATLTGPAGVSVPVELRDHGMIVATPTSTDGRSWSYTITTLAPGSHSFTVQTPGTNRPSAIWAFTVQEAQTPTITSVTAGGRLVPNNGATYYQNNIIIQGGATPGQQVEVYDRGASLGRFPVSDNGGWVVPARGFAVTSHVITARTIDGTKQSLPHTFTVQQGLLGDTSDFKYVDLQGWVWGGAGSARDFTFYVGAGRNYYALNNYTYTNSSHGVVLQKSYSNLQPGASYRYQFAVARMDGHFDYPVLRLRTSTGAASAYLTITSFNFIVLELYFIATTPEVILYLDSGQPSGNGNDYDMAWAAVSKMS